MTNRRIITIGVSIIASIVFVAVCATLALVVASRLASPVTPLAGGELAESNAPSASEAGPATAPGALRAPTPIPASDPLNVIAADPAATKDQHLVLRRVMIYNAAAIAEYDADSTAAGNDTLLLEAGTTLKIIGPRILEMFPDVTAVETCVWAPLGTASGNTNPQVAVRLRVTRLTASKLDWKSLDPAKMDSILIGKGDFVYLDPTLKAALPKVKAH